MGLHNLCIFFRKRHMALNRIAPRTPPSVRPKFCTLALACAFSISCKSNSDTSHPSSSLDSTIRRHTTTSHLTNSSLRTANRGWKQLGVACSGPSIGDNECESAYCATQGGGSGAAGSYCSIRCDAMTDNSSRCTDPSFSGKCTGRGHCQIRKPIAAPDTF